MPSDLPAIEEALWRFCVRVYGAPGAAEACLALQDEAGADIPLLLAALWSATEGPGPLDAASLTALDAAVAEWRDNVVRPLRRVRRWMKGAGHAGHPLRERVKAGELSAERHELAVIAGWLDARYADGAAPDGAGAALDAHLAWLGLGASGDWRVRLRPLIEAVCATLPPRRPGAS